MSLRSIVDPQEKQKQQKNQVTLRLTTKHTLYTICVRYIRGVSLMK